MTRLEPGVKAPGFTLSDYEGRKVSLKGFAGERVLIYFYPADDTPGCTKEACQYNDQLAQFETRGVHVLGVSPDDPATHARFRQKYDLNLVLLSDPDKKVMTAYGAYGDKMLYGKTVQGVIRSTCLISAQGKIERVWYGVRADGHASRVLNDVA